MAFGLTSRASGEPHRRVAEQAPARALRPDEHPAFAAARAELEGVGFRIAGRPFEGSRPYVVIGGRSNARWWLIPLENRRVTESGLALFQPTVASAHLMKAGAVAATRLGLSPLWARASVHVGGGAPLAEVFRATGLRFAFFTGTDCPHRKTTIQAMDVRGAIRGFAKIGSSSSVSALLAHEAEVLARLDQLGLRAGRVPSVLLAGKLGQLAALVTDTRKTPASRSPTAPGAAHVAFLRELAARTRRADAAGWLGRVLLGRVARTAPRLGPAWQRRLDAAARVVAEGTAPLTDRDLSHGDFTASNTFLADGGLYVFDWEYATDEVGPGHDLLHFVLSAPRARRLAPRAALALATAALPHVVEGEPRLHRALLVSYLASHAVSCAAREPGARVLAWTGEPAQARLLDAALESA